MTLSNRPIATLWAAVPGLLVLAGPPTGQVLAKQGYVVGVDISAGGERVVLSDLSGNIVGRDKRHLHNEQSPQKPGDTVDCVAGLVRSLLDQRGVRNREVLRMGSDLAVPSTLRRAVSGVPMIPRAGTISLWRLALRRFSTCLCFSTTMPAWPRWARYGLAWAAAIPPVTSSMSTGARE